MFILYIFQVLSTSKVINRYFMQTSSCIIILTLGIYTIFFSLCNCVIVRIFQFPGCFLRQLFMFHQVIRSKYFPGPKSYTLMFSKVTNSTIDLSYFCDKLFAALRVFVCCRVKWILRKSHYLLSYGLSIPQMAVLLNLRDMNGVQ